MAWSWRYEGPDGSPVSPEGVPAPGPFPSQGDAESFIGEHWRELLEAGVAQVTLFDGERRVYGPMGLDAG